MRITAAVARTAGQPFELESCELEAPQRGEVRVRVEACGICHTDLVARDQYWPVPLPAVLGHEGVGIVEALGEGVTQFAVGDRVLMSFGACGHCGSCREGQLGYCQQAPVFQVLAQREDGSSPNPESEKVSASAPSLDPPNDNQTHDEASPPDPETLGDVAAGEEKETSIDAPTGA